MIILDKLVAKGCDRLKSIKEGAGVFGFDGNKFKQGICLSKTTLRSEMSPKTAKAFSASCGDLTAMACICNTNNCNNVTIDDVIPEVISTDQKFFALKARVKEETIENSASGCRHDLIYLTFLIVIILNIIFSN